MTQPAAIDRSRFAPATDDYAAFCAGVRRLCAIDLAQYKRGQMERRVRTFAERRGHSGLPAYLGALGADPAELEAFLDRMTINVSQLWRNPEQWELLGRRLLPELAERGAVRAWSAGSSYGAEAYTLAAVARAAVPATRVQIVGTDIDARMVRRAREGRFSLDDARDARCAASTPATCCACARPPAPTTSSCAATPSSTSRPTSATRCTRGWPRRCARAAT